MLVLIGGAVVLLVLGRAAAPRRRRSAGTPSPPSPSLALGSIAAVIPLWDRVHEDGRRCSVVAGAVGVDGFSLFLTVVICVSVVILAALLADGYLRREGLEGPEPYVLMLLSASGGVIMASANDLIVMFLGLEILSIAVYVLAGMHLRRLRSGEAAIKYFVLGAFSSAFFLYGIALVYGATGTHEPGEDRRLPGHHHPRRQRPAARRASALLLVGFGFKVAAVPFHSWAPDVYQGSPSPVVAYMASGVKAAGFAGLLRVFVVTFGTYRLDWQPIVYWLAVLTLLVGAVLAIVQTDVKRMLAYSSINHAGFILVGVEAASRRRRVRRALLPGRLHLHGGRHLRRRHRGRPPGRRAPRPRRLPGAVAAASRSWPSPSPCSCWPRPARPLTSGFLAKFYVIDAAVEARSYWLALVAMLSAVISAFLYLRIVLTMYAGPDDEEEGAEPRRPRPPGPAAVPVAAAVALVVAVVATIGIGIVPDPLTDTARDATPELVGRRPPTDRPHPARFCVRNWLLADDATSARRIGWSSACRRRAAGWCR